MKTKNLESSEQLLRPNNNAELFQIPLSETAVMKKVETFDDQFMLSADSFSSEQKMSETHRELKRLLSEVRGPNNLRFQSKKEVLKYITDNYPNLAYAYERGELVTAAVVSVVVAVTVAITVAVAVTVAVTVNTVVTEG